MIKRYRMARLSDLNFGLLFFLELSKELGQAFRSSNRKGVFMAIIQVIPQPFFVVIILR